jgi:hypothetical protein
MLIIMQLVILVLMSKWVVLLLERLYKTCDKFQMCTLQNFPFLMQYVIIVKL